jgi:hypothetical protein
VDGGVWNIVERGRKGGKNIMSMDVVPAGDNNNASYDAFIYSFILSDLGDMYCRHETL